MVHWLCALWCITAVVCLFFFFFLFSLLPLLCCHVDTLLLLLKIFKCTILTCALCSLHGMTFIMIILFYFLSVEKSMLAKPTNKQKKKYCLFQKGPSWVWLSVCVRFCFLCRHLFRLCPVEFWWLWDNTAVLSWPSHDHLGWFISSKLKKKNEYLLICMGLGREGVRYVWMRAAVRGLTCEYTLR